MLLQRKSCDPPMLSDAFGNPNPETTDTPLRNQCAPQCTRDDLSRQLSGTFLSKLTYFQACCSSCAYAHEFLRAAAGKLTDTRRSSSSPSTPTIVPSHSWMRTLRPSMGSRLHHALPRAGQRNFACPPPRSRAALASAPAHPPREFFAEYEYSGPARIAGLADFSHRAANRVHSSLGISPKNVRAGKRAAAAHFRKCAGKLHASSLVTGAPLSSHIYSRRSSSMPLSSAMERLCGRCFFHAGQEHMVELQPLGAVQCDQSHSGLAFELIGVADESCGVQKIGNVSPASMLSARRA